MNALSDRLVPAILSCGRPTSACPPAPPALCPDSAKLPVEDGLVHSALVRISYIGFGYHATLDPESAVPKTAQDLLAPALMGKLALAGTSTGERWAASVLHGMGDERG